MSLETQQKKCIEYCDSNGLEVVKVFVEEGESAKTSDRTKLKEMLSFCRDNKNRLDSVVVYSLSRFARDKYSHFALRSLLSKLGIGLRSATEPIDDSSSGKLMEGILAAFSQFDNDVRSERTVAGMKAAVEKGRWPFPPPLGYCVAPDQQGGSTLVLDPVAAPLIKEAFKRYATGAYDRNHVLRIATAEGLRTRRGHKVSPQTFSNLLRNPIYAGRIVVDKWQVDCHGDFEPLVNDETFRRVEMVLAGRVPSPVPRLRSHPDFPLRHFVSCSDCRRPLTGSWSRGRTQRYPYYHCPSHSCKTRSIPKREIEERFIELLKSLQPRPAYMRLFKEIVLDVWEGRKGDANKISNALSSRLEELKRRKHRIVDAFVQEHTIDRQTYQEQVDRLNEEIAVAQLERHDAEIDEFDFDTALNFATKALSNAAEFWNGCSHEQRQRFQRILFPEGLLFDGEAFRTPVTSFVFSYLRPKSGAKSSLASRTGVEPT